MFGKPLAYIVKIKEIREIPGADRIELATVMDYTVVVKKGEYQPGDLAMYVEIDSLLPDGLSDELRAKYTAMKKLKVLSSQFKNLLNTHILNFSEIRSSKSRA